MLIHDSLNTLRRHWVAIILAIISSTMVAAPFLYFANSTNFSGIQMMGADAEDHYTARIHEVYEGYTSLGNVFLTNKNVPYVLPILGENMQARLGQVLRLSADEVVIFGKFFFSLLAFLLIYALAYKLWNSRLSALFSASLVILGDGLLSGPGAWLALLHGTSTTNTFLNYARPVNPEISGSVMFLGLICIFLLYFKPEIKNKFWLSISTAFFTAVSLYISPYTFTFLVAVQVICFGWFCLQRKWASATTILGVGVGTALLMVPYLLNFSHVNTDPSYLDLLMRGGMTYSHSPILGWWLPLILISALFFWPKDLKDSRRFFIACALALILVLNQQIISGKIVQPAHYHWYITIPLAGIIAGMYITTISRRLFKNIRWQNICFVLAGLILFSNALFTDLRSYTVSSSNFSDLRRMSSLFAYLDVRKQTDFVYANNEISSYLPMYTNDDVATSKQALNYLIPRQYFEDMVMLKYRLRGIAPRDIAAVLKKERGIVSSEIYALYWRNQAGSFEAIPDSDLERLAKRYSEEYARPLQDLFQEKKITLLIWDKKSEPEWQADQLSFLHKIYDVDSLEVFEVK